MTPDTPSPQGTPPLRVPASPQPRKKARWFLYGCGGLLAFVALVVLTVVLTLWWIQRPIKPVVLSAQEKAKVEQKLDRLEGSDAPNRTPRKVPAPNLTAGSSPGTVEPPRDIAAAPDKNKDRVYEPGSKALKLTEREINGLLNANTDLGNSVRLEFARDAINAYVAVPIPKDFPIGGGKMFRARGRFSVSLGNGGTPFAVLEDVTVLGVSLPKAWLGGLKGENLLADAAGKRDGRPALKAIKSLRVEPGALLLELED